MKISRLRRLAVVASLLVVFASTGRSQIQVTGFSPAQNILPHMLGYNNQMSGSANPWSLSSRRSALVAARPGVFRYPGGTVSTYWDTFHGRRFNDVVTINASDNTPPRDFTQTKYTIDWVAVAAGQPNPISDFDLAYDAVAASPGGAMEVVFVLNMTTPGADYYAAAWGRSVDQTPQSADWWAMMDDRYARAIIMLDDAVAAGIPVKYVEFGNEYYFGAGTTSPTGATVEPYSAGVVPNDPAMRGAFPGSGTDYAAAVNDWAPNLLSRYPGVRLCAIGSDGGGSGRRANWNNDVVSLISPTLVPAVSYHIYGGITAGDVTSTEANLGTALTSWNSFWQSTKTTAQVLTNREAWFTEFNANVGPQSWGQGLQALSSLKTWLSDGNLGLALMHQFVTPIMSGTGPSITATGRAISLFNLAAKAKTRVRGLNLSSVPTLAGSGSPGLASVFGYAFDTGTGTDINYVLVNLRGSNNSISLTGIAGAVGAAFTRASASLSATADPGETSGMLAATETLPAYSITVFTVAGGSPPVTTTFYSLASEDGWILESAQGSNVGNTNATTGDSSGGSLRLGDNSQNRKSLLIFSFDTSSIPDSATVTGVQLRMRRGGASGTNPFSTHGTAQVDIIGGSGFGGSTTLAGSDYQASAGASNTGSMSNPVASGDWSEAALSSTAHAHVNVSGRTQVRVAFTLSHNGDSGADYLSFYSGEATSGSRPELVVTYQP